MYISIKIVRLLGKNNTQDKSKMVSLIYLCLIQIQAKKNLDSVIREQEKIAEVCALRVPF